MINLTKLNGSDIVLNAELIETVESRPDTIITLTDGNKIMVKESVSQVVDKTIKYRQDINLISLENISRLMEEKS